MRVIADKEMTSITSAYECRIQFGGVNVTLFQNHILYMILSFKLFDYIIELQTTNTSMNETQHTIAPDSVTLIE